MLKINLTTCLIQIKAQILTKEFILKHIDVSYDTIHTIHTTIL